MSPLLLFASQLSVVSCRTGMLFPSPRAGVVEDLGLLIVQMNGELIWSGAGHPG